MTRDVKLDILKIVGDIGMPENENDELNKAKSIATRFNLSVDLATEIMFTVANFVSKSEAYNALTPIDQVNVILSTMIIVERCYKLDKVLQSGEIRSIPSEEVKRAIEITELEKGIERLDNGNPGSTGGEV